MIQLHADPNASPNNHFPDEVATPKHLQFLVGDPPKLMQIFSGIAIPSWDSEKLLDYTDLLVHLGVPAPAGTQGKDWDFTATTSLAAIGNMGAGDFTFATNECTVLTAPAMIDGKRVDELILYAKLAVQGDPFSLLGRISYHVEVLSEIPVVGAVRGTIRWLEQYGDPTSGVAMGAPPMFRLTCDAAPSVYTTEMPQKEHGYWSVPYAFLGLPLDQALTITPELMPGAFAGPPAGYLAGARVTPSSHTVTLTPAQPTVTNQDFEMTFDALG